MDLDPGKEFQQIIPKKKFEEAYFSINELKLLENLSFIFRDAPADMMIEVTHLKNEPWDRTMKEKGEFKLIDYLLAVDSDVDSLPLEEARERMEDAAEMFRTFGVA